MANGLLSIDMEGRIAAYNRPAIELLGLGETEARQKNLNSLIDFTATGIRKTLTDCVSILDHEIRYKDKTGAIIPLALSASPILSEAGGCRGAVIVLRDLREIKKLEEKVQRTEKLAAIGELAAGIAHEIRNPLSSIRGFAQFLRHALENKPREQAYADIMVSEVDRINRVVSDLLTFARPMKAQPVPTDISELIEHVLRLVAADASSRDVCIQTRVSKIKNFPIDASQITQALLNLLLNALQAVDQGGRIEIGAEYRTETNCLVIWVADNGPGISLDRKAKIFEPFFTTRKKGTGLGLAIVHKIVENHEGEISVESPVGENAGGSRITITIPGRISDNEGTAPPHATI